MSTHRSINRICCAALVLVLLVTVLFCNAERLGLQRSDNARGYEARLFDTSRVHTIDIIMDDWEGFLETCENEEYQSCGVVIDNEAYRNVALRAKGNTSLSMVRSYGNNRYSFKIEFDHYDSGNTYYGLDKLCLNNIIQDHTYMKDYLAYELMRDMGVPSPLCSYVYITVNGEDWGLYLAVEALEESFLSRNYGKDYGNLYKPDTIGFGGGSGGGNREHPEGFPDMGGGFPDGNGDMPEMPEGFPGGENNGENGDRRGMRGGGGMGSSDVKLQYIDDDPDSYSNIFDSAKTEITTADKTRLISSLKNLSANEEIESVVDVDEVIRYMAVHNFLCNGDSYTGAMVHNYYLYEKDGQLSMLPWDYNLSFGAFGGMGGKSGGSDATSTANSPIDSPVSGSLDDRPMAAWIFADEKYTALYHRSYAEFAEAAQGSGGIADTISQVSALISPYIEKDPTKFCTMEEFQTGIRTLQDFCALRLESICGQLDGSIPSTTKGQQDSGALIDASGISISDMGSMNFGDAGGPGGRPGNQDADDSAGSGKNSAPGTQEASPASPAPSESNPPETRDTPGAAGGTPSPGAGEAAAQTGRQRGAPFPGGGTPQEQQPNPQSLLWLGVSAAVLLAGLLFALKYRRW